MLTKFFFVNKLIISIITLMIGLIFFLNGFLQINNKKEYLINKQNVENKNLEKIEQQKNLTENKQNNIIKFVQVENEENLSENYDKEVVVVVKKNDTFSKIISPFFKSNEIKNNIIDKIRNNINLKNLRIDQKIYFYLNKENEVNKIIIPKDFKTNIIIEISSEKISSKIEKVELSKDIISKKVIINSSIFQDGRLENIPIIILVEVIKLYSFDVDFQRDIQKNDELQISYEAFYNDKRQTMSYGKVKYTNLILQKKQLEYFVFETDEGYLDYFDRDGKNIKKALMKTPIDGARLSSSFGMRKHPISGFNKLHKGVDFAAPIGTPIYAAGNGVIEFIGRNGGYGKYIRIRHNTSYKTAYAHLSSYKKNISRGSRVNQGDIIGFVGSTGKSTGPHLHYEIIYQGKQINPMKLKLPPRRTLKGKELKKFTQNMNDIYSEFLYSLYE